MNQTNYPQQKIKRISVRKSLHTSLSSVHLDMAIRKNNIKNYMKNDTKMVKLYNHTQCEEDFQLQNHLCQLKKQCSQLARQIKIKDNQTNQTKNSGNFAFEKSKKIIENKKDMQKKIQDLQRKIEQVCYKKEVALLSCKTYQHILDRMKKDQISRQVAKNRLQDQVKNLKKIYYNYQNQYHSISQFQKLSSNGLKQAKWTKQQESSCRAKNVQMQKTELQIKIQKYKKLKQRQKQTVLIQQLAADDIQDVDLQKMKKFIMVQLFLRQLMKVKSLKLKNHYEQYQLAFIKIKSNTNAKDHISLKRQFFKFEQTYNEKALLVKDLHKEIKQAELKNKELKKNLFQLRIQEMQIIQGLQNKQNMQQNFKVTINKKELCQKSLQCQQIYKKIESWLSLQSRRLQIKNENIKPCQSFTKILQKLQELQI